MAKSSNNDGKGTREINWIWFALGLLLVVFGLNIVVDPIVPHYDISIDIRPFQIPVAISSTGIGLYLFWASFTSKRYDGNDVLMCPRCNGSFERKNVQENKCPKCDVDLEPLEGFYERHPEMKDEDD